MNSPSPTAILQWIGSAALLFCSGCATTTNGAWYHQSDDGANSLYFTFIYKGPDVELLGATINGERARGWQCEPKASSSDGMTGPAPTIHPGQLVVLWLPESPKVACEITVPIDAKLRLRKSGHRESSVKIEVSTSLPSALPESWLDCPSQTGGSESLPSATSATDESPSASDENTAMRSETISTRIAKQAQRSARDLEVSSLHCARREVQGTDLWNAQKG